MSTFCIYLMDPFTDVIVKSDISFLLERKSSPFLCVMWPLTDASKHLASNLTSSIHSEEAFPLQPPSLFWPFYSLVSSLSEFVILAKLLQWYSST